MTSLIDVIFLLLLFFMLSSTFSRFAQVELHAGGTDTVSGAAIEKVLFLRLTEAGQTLNGRSIPLEALDAALRETPEATLLISVTTAATAQALTDVIVAVSKVQGLTFSVLEGA